MLSNVLIGVRWLLKPWKTQEIQGNADLEIMALWLHVHHKSLCLITSMKEFSFRYCRELQRERVEFSPYYRKIAQEIKDIWILQDQPRSGMLSLKTSHAFMSAKDCFVFIYFRFCKISNSQQTMIVVLS